MKTEIKKNILLVVLVLGAVGFLGVQYFKKQDEPKDYPYVETDLGQIRPGVYTK